MIFKRPLIFSLAVLIAALVVSEALAGGYSVSATGTRARSMGGAFRAVADDWSAVYYNPAGLASVEQSQLNLSLNFESYRPSFDPDVTSSGYEFGFVTGERYPENVVGFFPNLNGIATAPFGLPVTFAVAVHQAYDENLKWDLYRFPVGYDRDQSKLPNIEYRNNLDVIDFRSALATSFADDRFHVGLGIMIRRGDLNTCQMFLKPTPVMDDRLNGRPYDYIADWADADLFGIGIGLNLGVLYDVNDRISVGASYQPKTKISMEGDGVARLYTPDNPYIADYFDQWSSPGGLDSLYSGLIYESSHEVEADMTLPSEFGIGLAFHPSDYVTIAADFSMTMWSEFEDIEMDYLHSQGLSKWPLINDLLMGHPHNYSWDDAMRISLGIEGQASEYVSLRGGYSFDQSAVPDEQATPLVADTGDRHHIAGGLSYFHRRFEFAFGAELVAMPERAVTELSDINDDGIWDNLTGTYANTALNTSFSVTLRF